MRFYSREVKNVTRNIKISGEEFEIARSVYHNIEAINADVLAYDDNNEPIYFKKAYGKYH